MRTYENYADSKFHSAQIDPVAITFLLSWVNWDNVGTVDLLVVETVNRARTCDPKHSPSPVVTKCKVEINTLHVSVNYHESRCVPMTLTSVNGPDDCICGLRCVNFHFSADTRPVLFDWFGHLTRATFLLLMVNKVHNKTVGLLKVECGVFKYFVKYHSFCLNDIYLNHICLKHSHHHMVSVKY